MRWSVVVIVAFVLLVLEKGFATTLEVADVLPSFLLVFTVFMALVAPVEVVPWCAILLGLVTDFTTPYATAGGMSDYAVIGPHALGFFAAGYISVQMRGLMFRDSPWSIGAMVCIAGIFAHLVIVALLNLRGLPFLTAEPVGQWNWADQLVYRFFGLLYSALVAIPIAYLLIRLEPLMGITASGNRRARRVV